MICIGILLICGISIPYAVLSTCLGNINDGAVDINGYAVFVSRFAKYIYLPKVSTILALSIQQS